ncbi:heme o synthase [candidate division KSB1 bacterium]
MRSKIHDYYLLTKPTIMLLVLLTGATSIVLEGSAVTQPLTFALALTGLFLTGGGANALNQIFEKDIDAQMYRTRYRRPLPSGRLTIREALVFSIVISTAGIALFALLFNWFSALLSLGTILFYAFFYTLYLKPNTPQNIVIGGAAGAMAPVIAWTAVSGGFAATPWILFLIVFFWTPPHFWALALYLKDDYERANLPMMPNIKGAATTLNLILIHTIILFIITIALFIAQPGWFYLIAAVILGGFFIEKTIDARRIMEQRLYRRLFNYSILHLFLLFVSMIIDDLIGVL